MTPDASPIRWSRGASITDVFPAQREAATFAEFVDALAADRAPRKAGAPYVCGPLNGTGYRCAPGALPRRWLAVDLDRIAPDRLPDVRLWFAGFSGCGWPTHSSRPDAPRERVLIELDRDATRDEAIAIGEVLAARLRVDFGDDVAVDTSTHQGEQPVFLVPAGAAIARFFGDPLRVDDYLQAAREAKDKQQGASKAPGAPVAALDAIRRGEGLHENIGRLVARWARAGLGPEELRAAAVGVLELARPVRGGRVDEIARDELGRLIAGALTKFGPVTAEGAPQPLDIFRGAVTPTIDAADFPAVLHDYAVPLAAAAGHDPAAYLAAMLAAGAAATPDGLRLLVDADTSWFESARLWVLLLGAPGSAKTPAIRAAMAPIFEAHRAMREQHARDCAALGADDPKPPAPALLSNDPTIEALSDVLKANPRGIAAVFEELDSWLGSHDAYRGGAGSKDRGEWLRLFDGGPHQVDRVKRGSTFVPNWGVSILAATTPAGLRRHAKDLPPDGLIQRFLPVMVRPMGAATATPGQRETIAPAALRYAATLRELVDAGPGVVRMTPGAAQVFAERRAALRDELAAVVGVADPLAGHLAKHAGLLARVALTMHALEHGRAAAEVLLHEDTMRQGVRLLRALARHAVALFDTLAGDGGSVALARSVGRAIVAAEWETVTRRELIHGCRAFRDAPEPAREAALRFLVDAAWLTPDDAGRVYAGRPASFSVHPAALTRFADEGQALKARRAAVRELFGG